MLTITLSELMSDVQVTHPKMDGSLEESGESQRLRRSLQQIAQESISADLLRECGLPEDSLTALPDGVNGQQWSWAGVAELSTSLLKAVDAAVGHALLVSFPTSFSDTCVKILCLFVQVDKRIYLMRRTGLGSLGLQLFYSRNAGS